MGFITDKMHKAENVMRHKCHTNHILKTKADFKHLNFWALNVESVIFWFGLWLFSGVSHRAKYREFPLLQQWKKREVICKTLRKELFLCWRCISQPSVSFAAGSWTIRRSGRQKSHLCSVSHHRASKKLLQNAKLSLKKPFSSALPVVSSFVWTATCVSPPSPGSLASPQGSGQLQCCFQASALWNCS